MRNFITIKNENERKIFLNYCKKNNVVLSSGIKIGTKTEKNVFSKPGFQIFFEDYYFNYLTFAHSTSYAQVNSDGYYNEVKFYDFFGSKKVWSWNEREYWKKI